MNTRIIQAKQDLTYLSWSKIRDSSGMAGSFLKANSNLGGIKVYYKLSNYDNMRGVVGHESVNELIVDRLLTLLGIEHLHYQLVHADILVDGKVLDTYVCASENFREKGEDKQAIDVYFERERLANESALEFCVRMGWEDYIWRMLVVDYLILNRDRHGANIEVLRNKKKKTIRLAPLFDHGLSLLCRCESEEAINRYDVMEDKPVQSFVGSRSAKDNLNLIPVDQMPNLKPLKESDKSLLLEGLDGVISRNLQDKIWNMIWKRWCWYEDFCNSRCSGSYAKRSGLSSLL
ncbi:MAG: hypothetical protein J5916_01000 [Oscillospiraceae bacterium]|nr:hypothetical protein [Clostridia bacterium]MBO5638457.1 hypothetical protein [Oscillospiraceae bacterium]